ncbi:hypothetical protein DFH07DRAFT_805079 [Mycena maculata]|uniref:MYND-type domain-containing protein n=1 Tax=Mycena maculata TaxID=230809 RepID=A0AAD7JSY2_9AGAR|nr:hypothetical protein DFH07DRAFT_805079 [Mycena maculata]
MPAISVCSGTKDQCYHCGRPGNLRACSNCQVARYCTRDCQRADWNLNHKQVCVDYKADLATYPSPTMEDEVQDFMKWNDAWKGALDAWGTFAADLANQSPDFLLTHSFFLSLERRPNATRAAMKSYRVVSGRMRPDSEILDEFQSIPDAQYRAQIINGFRNLPPHADCVRFTVVLNSHYLYSHGGNLVGLTFPNGQARAFTDPSSTESRVLSTGLATVWSRQFPEYVQRGKTSAHIEVLRDLTQAANSISNVD